jgi:predicted transcriptional regulator
VALSVSWQSWFDDALTIAERTMICRMGTLTIRIDAEVTRALASLTSEGQSRSEVARQAILDAERARRRARLRAEAEELRNDPEDVAAARELVAEMDAIRAW